LPQAELPILLQFVDAAVTVMKTLAGGAFRATRAAL
jgi:hypothetical protein